jgi:hypothetical protein
MVDLTSPGVSALLSRRWPEVGQHVGYDLCWIEETVVSFRPVICTTHDPLRVDRDPGAMPTLPFGDKAERH